MKIIDLLRERSQIKYKKMNLFSFINNNRKIKLFGLPQNNFGQITVFDFIA